MHEAERGPAEPDGHINLSDPNVEPVLSRVLPTSKHPSKNIWRLIPPRRLAFCGGGVRCVAHVGVMKSLKSKGLLSCVKEVIGISAGAFFALLFALDYTIEQIERLSIEMDFTVLGSIDPEDIILFPLTFGLNSGESIERLVASVLRQKGLSPDITFAGLSALKTSFRCYATELQTSQIKELSVRTTPNMKVTVGVRASMSFPCMYSPVKEGNSLLVDGGLLHNLPLVFLTDEEIQETLGVFFVAEPKLVAEPVEGVLELFKYMYEAAIDMRNRPFLKKFKDRLIIINTDDFNGLDFSESKERRSALIESAYKATEKFLEFRKPPIRRFSVV